MTRPPAPPETGFGSLAVSFAGRTPDRGELLGVRARLQAQAVVGPWTLLGESG